MKSLPLLRQSLPADAKQIRIAMKRAVSYLSEGRESGAKNTVRLLIDDVDYLVDQVVEHRVESVVVDEAYLLVYSLCKPWYCRDHWVLHEDLVLRIGEGSSFAAVIETLEFLAEDEDCSAIMVGGALARSSRALSRLYMRYGFVPETSTPSLTKLRR